MGTFCWLLQNYSVHLDGNSARVLQQQCYFCLLFERIAISEVLWGCKFILRSLKIDYAIFELFRVKMRVHPFILLPLCGIEVLWFFTSLCTFTLVLPGDTGTQYSLVLHVSILHMVADPSD